MAVLYLLGQLPHLGWSAMLMPQRHYQQGEFGACLAATTFSLELGDSGLAHHCRVHLTLHRLNAGLP